jgi:hypothetical protein
MKVLIALLVLMTIAHAEEVKKVQVFHESEPMALVVQPDSTIEISYITLPPLLREVGVKPGQILVQGKWTDRDNVLEGQAYAFVHGCEPIPYPVRGVVNRETGVLVVIGPMPVSCTDRTLVWKEGSVMTFDQSSSPVIKREKKKERVVERKPKPRREPRPSRQEPYVPQPYPWREQWRW